MVTAATKFERLDVPLIVGFPFDLLPRLQGPALGALDWRRVSEWPIGGVAPCKTFGGDFRRVVLRPASQKIDIRVGAQGVQSSDCACRNPIVDKPPEGSLHQEECGVEGLKVVRTERRSPSEQATYPPNN